MAVMREEPPQNIATFYHSLFDDIAYKFVIKNAQLQCLGSQCRIYSPELLSMRPVSSMVVFSILLCVMDMMSILMDGYFLQRTLRLILRIYSYSSFGFRL